MLRPSGRPTADGCDDRCVHEEVLNRCQAALPGWRGLTVDDFDFDDPKGFSSFTMGIRARRNVEPAAVLYRHLAGKENAILEFAEERAVFLLLGDQRIAARCHHYDGTCRIEEFYEGRTLTPDDLFQPDVQQGIATELHRLHRLQPEGLPSKTFFELLHDKWGPMARTVLTERRESFPPSERDLCDDLAAIHSDETLSKALRCLPDRSPVFCHNDTYHGNVMRLDDGSIKLLDFEFSCLNHICFDFANLFAETVMVHGLPDPPHFRIAEPAWSDADIASLVGFYLDNSSFPNAAEREAELTVLVTETKRALILSDYMYAMAALPLALEPIQKIRFLPYSHQRFHRFLANWEKEFG